MIISLGSKKGVVEKAIKKYGKLISVTREKVNEFKEKNGSSRICDCYGFYYRGDNIAKQIVKIAGETNVTREEKLMIIKDYNTEDIRQGDYLKMDGINYRIFDLGNSFDLYFDISLERVI